jgi:hypothetical protein
MEDVGHFCMALSMAITTITSYLCFLVTAAMVTLELVITAQCFCVAKALQTVGDAGVLVNINLKIKKIFIFTAHL